VGIFEWMEFGFDAVEELVIGGAEQIGKVTDKSNREKARHSLVT